MAKWNIDEANARRLAVKAECDPRTIRSVVQGDEVGRSSMARERAKAVLEEEGYVTVTVVGANGRRKQKKIKRKVP